MKKLLIIFLVLALALTTSQAAEFYKSYEISGDYGMPESVFVGGTECANIDCSETTSDSFDIYSGNAMTCIDQARNGDLTIAQFNSCMEQYKSQNGIVTTSTVITGVEIPSSFGHLIWFSASDDEYIPHYSKIEEYNCDSQICFDTQGLNDFSFKKKDGAIAEIGQVNIRNTENELKPIQIEVPVEIEQTVCSAYRRTLSNAWEPSIPQSYSDFNADTVVNLEITNNETGDVLHDDQVFLPIEADTCAAFAAFEWTPSSSLENTSVTFSFTTQVVDSQVINALVDRYDVTETIYPTNLDNTCWARIENFTLTNDPNEELSTSIAQITQGEYLYATLDVGAFRNNAITPSNYLLEIEVDGTTYFSQSFSTTSMDLDEQIINLTPHTSSFPVGTYDVVARATPQVQNCDFVQSLTHTQQLDILQIGEYDLSVSVRNQDAQALQGANVELELVDAKDNFAVEPNYYQTRLTNNLGQTNFVDLIPGDYQYRVFLQGYAPKTGSMTIGSDSNLVITLQEDNQAPVVDLPQEFYSTINDPVEINLEDYVYDINQPFSTLSLSAEVLQGSGSASIVGSNLIVNSQNLEDVIVEVSAVDSQGLNGNDTTTIHFTTNTAPVINNFEANPNNGEAPFTTQFEISVSDLENDDLTCNLNFGDSTQITQDCSNLSTTTHTYLNAGTYKAGLTVSDDDFGVYEEIDIVVFTREIPEEYDKLESSSVELNIPANIAPGEFNFSIDIKDETLKTRQLFIEPTIICGDVTTGLSSSNSQIPSRIISSSDRDEFSYEFVLDTQEFKNDLPKNEVCTFKVRLNDGMGTDITKSKLVEFNYLSEESQMQSIRGESTDIISYMDIILQGANYGYNSESFRLINNEDDGKKISLSITSAELNLNKKIEANIGPYAQRDVTLSYFIGDVETGLYPVRISINDGEEHQTRYSYIRID